MSIPGATDLAGLRHVATFCGQCNCGCPELVADARNGVLDDVLAAAR